MNIDPMIADLIAQTQNTTVLCTITLKENGDGKLHPVIKCGRIEAIGEFVESSFSPMIGSELNVNGENFIVAGTLHRVDGDDDRFFIFDGRKTLGNIPWKNNVMSMSNDDLYVSVRAHKLTPTQAQSRCYDLGKYKVNEQVLVDGTGLHLNLSPMD
jgi:hypothetical protein